MTRSSRVQLGLVLVVGIVVPGFADYVLSTAGYPSVGMVVWAFGYLTMALVVWYRWLRPLDLSGPAG